MKIQCRMFLHLKSHMLTPKDLNMLLLMVKWLSKMKITMAQEAGKRFMAPIEFCKGYSEHDT